MRNRRETDNDNEITQTVFGDLITFLMVLFLLLFLFSQNDKFEGFISNNLQNDNFNKVKQSYNETLSGEKIISKQITKIRKVEQNKQEKVKDLERLIKKLLEKLNKEKNKDKDKDKKLLEKSLKIEQRYQQEIKKIINEINKDIPTLASINNIQQMLKDHIQTAKQSMQNADKLNRQIQSTNISKLLTNTNHLNEIQNDIKTLQQALKNTSKDISDEKKDQVKDILKELQKTEIKLKEQESRDKKEQKKELEKIKEITNQYKNLNKEKPIKKLTKLQKELDKAITSNDIKSIKEMVLQIKKTVQTEDHSEKSLLKEMNKLNNERINNQIEIIENKKNLKFSRKKIQQKKQDLKKVLREIKKKELKKEIEEILKNPLNQKSENELKNKLKEIKKLNQAQQASENSKTEIAYLKKEQQLISKMQKLMNSVNININQPKTKELKLKSQKLHTSINKEKASQNEKLKVINKINKILKDENQIKSELTAQKLEDELNYLNSLIKKQESKKNSETNITYINDQKKLIADMKNLLMDMKTSINEDPQKKLKDTNSDLKEIKETPKQSLPSIISDIQKLENKKHKQRSKIQKDEALNALKDIKINLKGQTIHEDDKALKNIQKELDIFQLKLSKNHKIDNNELKDIIQKLKELAKDKNILMFKGKQKEKLIDILNKMASDQEKKKSLDELLQKLQNALNDYKKEAKIETIKEQVKKLNASDTEKLKDHLNEYESEKLNDKESYIINKIKTVLSKENKRDIDLKKKHIEQLLSKLQNQIQKTNIDPMLKQLNILLTENQSITDSEEVDVTKVLKSLQNDLNIPKDIKTKLKKHIQTSEIKNKVAKQIDALQKSPNAIASKEMSKLESLLNKLLKTIKDEPVSRPENLFSLPKILNLNEQNNDIYVINDDKYMKVVLSNAILFPSGKASINSNSKKLLLPITKILTDVKNEIIIAGHTDNVPINNEEFESNWELSFFRSYNVLKYILKNTKLNPTQLSCVGYGEFKPIKPNNSAKNRAKNRRIEIIIIKDPK